MLARRARMVAGRGGGGLQVCGMCGGGAERQSKREGRGHWASRDNRKQFLEQLGRRLGIEGEEEWRRVGVKQVREEGGSGMLAYYNYSLGRALEDLLGIEGRRRRQVGHWQEEGNRRRGLEEVERRMGVKGEEQWRRVGSKEVREAGGGSLLAHYDNSVTRMLQELRGEEWGAERRRGRGAWEEEGQRRQFLTRLAAQLGIERPEQWQRVAQQEVAGRGGAGLLSRYDGSLLAALRDTFREVAWEEAWSRRGHTAGYWREAANGRSFLQELARSRGVERPREWRRVRSREVVEAGGSGLLRTHGSLWQALVACFPEEPMFQSPANQVLCVASVPPEAWEEEEAVVAFMRDAEVQLGIRQASEWYRVSRAQLSQLGGAGMLARWGLAGSLRIAFPHVTWDDDLCSSLTAKKATQRHMRSLVEAMVGPKGVVLEDYLHPALGEEREAGHAT